MAKEKIKPLNGVQFRNYTVLVGCPHCGHKDDDNSISITEFYESYYPVTDIHRQTVWCTNCGEHFLVGYELHVMSWPINTDRETAKCIRIANSTHNEGKLTTEES